MLPRAIQPPIHDFEGFTLTPPQIRTLANGITCHYFHSPNLSLIHLTVSIKAGVLYEPSRRVASFCYELLKESHPTLSAHELEALFDYYGTAIATTLTLGFVHVNLQVPKKNCPQVLPVLVELLQHAQFRFENLEIFREKSRKDLEYYAQKPSFRSQQLVQYSYFGNVFAAGKMVEQSDIEAITLQQLQDYYARTCVATNMQLLLTGNFSESELTEVLALFQPIPQGEKMPILPPVNQYFTPQRINETWEGAQQTSLALCRPAPLYLDSDIHAFLFLTTLYTNYFGSRLMQNLREKNGFTYGISGGSRYYESGALFSIESEVNNDKAEEALQECFTEMRRLCTELVETDELETVRNYLIGSALRSVDGTVSYMQTYTTWNDFGSNETRFARYMAAFQSVTPEKLRELACQWLRPEEFTVIMVGAMAQ